MQVSKEEVQQEGLALPESSRHGDDHHRAVPHILAEEQCAQCLLVKREGVLRRWGHYLNAPPGLKGLWFIWNQFDFFYFSSMKSCVDLYVCL